MADLTLANQKLTSLVSALRSELSRVASAAPEDTGAGEISAALKGQLDAYQAKARADADTIEECVVRIGDMGEEVRALRARAEKAEGRVEELRVTGADREREVEVLSRGRGVPKGDDLRALLAQQGSMAGELARRELEVEEMKRVAADSKDKMRVAEENAAQIAEQLNLIKTTSEEVAMLEAEEIARLEGEVGVMRGQVVEVRREKEETRDGYEKKFMSQAGEIDELKSEVLKLKRQVNR